KYYRIDCFILVMGALVGSFVTSYAKARAENFIESCQIGMFERAERVILLSIGSIIPVTFLVVIWILFIGTNFTAIQRILHTHKALSTNQG
ncbi:MAG: hypothetical protein NC930_02335, partial [Candidatus Omnitrophica bacterium]|nr:hypothetical protein [Candidatus Omnitrophota bacterium]